MLEATQTIGRVAVDTTPFFDYLHEHHATARLAEALCEIVDARSAAAQRRARTRLQPIPIPILVAPERARRAG
jgi:hypothetical protein